MYLVHLLREVVKIIDDIVLLNDVDGGNVCLPVARYHEN